MKKRLFLIAAAALALVACTKEEAYEPEVVVSHKGVKVTIGASFEDLTNGTKSDYTAGGDFYWSTGDAIWIGSDMASGKTNWGYGSIITNQTNKGPGYAIADFDCILTGGTTTAVAAVFPYESVTPSYTAGSSLGTLSLELKKTISWANSSGLSDDLKKEIYDRNKGLETTDPKYVSDIKFMQADNVMVARYEDIYTGGYPQGTTTGLQFYNVGGVFCLTLNNIPPGAEKLVFTTDKKITGTFPVSNVEVNSNNYPQIVTDATETEAEKSVTIEFETITSSLNTRVFFIPVPVGSYVIGFDTQDHDGNSLWKFSAARANTVERGHIVKMPALTHVVVSGGGDSATNIITTPTGCNETVYLPSTESNIYVRMNQTGGTITLAYSTIEGAKHPANVYLEALGDIENLNINLPDSHVELKGSGSVAQVITNVTSYTSYATLKVESTVKIGKDSEDNSGLTITGGSLDLQAPTQKVTINIPPDATNTTENKVQINITSTIKALAVERAAYTDKAVDKIYVKLAPPVSETPTAITVEGINVEEKNCNLYVAPGVTVTTATTSATENTIEGTVTTLTAQPEQGASESTTVNVTVTGAVDNLAATGAGTTVTVTDNATVTGSITASDKATVIADNSAIQTLEEEDKTAESGGTITGVTVGSVALVGETGYKTLAEAIEAAEENEIVTIIKADAAAEKYTLPAIDKNVTIASNVAGVVINHTSNSTAIASITSNKTVTFKNITFNLGHSYYHGFGTSNNSASGALVMDGCTIEGSLSLYGVSTFTNCMFTATEDNAGWYNIWAVLSDATFNNCTFSNTNRAVNVYDFKHTSEVKNVSFTNCSFTGTAKKKAAINIHHNPDGTAAKYAVTINNCTTNGTWAASTDDTGEAETTVCSSPLWMVSDIVNWTNGDITVNGVNVYDAPVAQIGTTTYATLAAAFEAANNTTGATITLLADCETGEYDFTKEALKIESEGTVLDLNGKTITVAKNFTFGVTASNVTIKNGTIASGPNSQKRTNFNSYVLVIGAVASDASISNVTIQNVSTRGGVSVGGSSDAHIKGTATGTVLTNCNVLSGDYYAVCSQNHSVVTIDGGTYTSNQTAVNSGVGQLGLGVLQAYFVGDDGPEGAINVVAGTFNGVINPGNHNLIYISGGTFDHNPPAVCISPGFGATNNGDGTWTVSEVNYVAQIESTKYETLAEAIAAVPDNTETTITMIGDDTIMGNAGITITSSKRIILDLNGHTVKNAVNENKASQVFDNYGVFKIIDTKGGGVLKNGIEEGTEPGEWWSTPQYNYATNVVKNSGTLTIDGAKLHQTASGSICYAVDNNSTSYDVTLNLVSGILIGERTVVRQFCNSAVKNNTVNISGGEITTEGKAGLWIQLPGSNPNSMKMATLNISGGTLRANDYAFYDYSYGDGWDNVHYSVTGGTFIGSVESVKTIGASGHKFISGGTFSVDPSAYVAAGYGVTYANEKWTVAPATLTWDGSSTAAPTYLDENTFGIFSAAQMAGFASAVNNGTSYAGKTVVLMNDINLSNHTWTPIGNTSNVAGAGFAGTFDGNGKTVSNLAVSQLNGEASFAGFFGIVNPSKGNTVTIKDLTIDTFTVTSNHQAGAIVGHSGIDAGVGKVVITGCTVSEGTLTSTPTQTANGNDDANQVGAIAGALFNGAHEITSNTVSNVTINGFRDLGGLVGFMTAGTVSGNAITGATINQVDANYTVAAWKKTQTVNEFVGRRSNSEATCNTAWELGEGNTFDGTINRLISGVAQIDSSYYATLAEAVAAVPTDGTKTTITMIANETTASGVQIVIPKNKNIVLDLNGKTISGTGGNASTSFYYLNNNGTLEIKDSSTGGKITSSCPNPDGSYYKEYATIYNANVFTLTSGTVENTTNGGATYAVTNSSNAWGVGDDKHTTFYMNGGTLTAPHGDQTLRVYQNCKDSNNPDSHNTVVINGGVILDNGIFVDTYLYQPNPSVTGNSVNTSITIKSGEIHGLIDMKLRHSYNTTLSITGGTFVDARFRIRKYTSEWGAGVAEPTTPVFNISNGTFTFENANTAFVSTDWTSYPKPYSITGGTFSVNPSTYVDAGYAATQSENVWTVEEKPAAKIGTVGYASLSAALANVTKDAPLTWVDDEVWSDDTPVYYNGTFYATMAAAIEAVKNESANVDPNIYCKPNTTITGGDYHSRLTTSVTFFGNNATLNGNSEMDLGTYFPQEKDVTYKFYNLKKCGIWGKKNSGYTTTIEMANCQDVHEYLVQYESGNGVVNGTISNCTFIYGNGYAAHMSGISQDCGGTLNISGCTFTNMPCGANIKNDAGNLAVTITGCEFIDCGNTTSASAAGASAYAAAVRRGAKTNASGSFTMTGCTFTYSSGVEKALDTDIVIGENRTNNGEGVITYNISNTAASVKVYQVHASGVEATLKSEMTLTTSNVANGNNE